MSDALPLPGSLEAAAVVLALAYLVLAIRQQPLCWLAGAGSAALYLALLWETRLYLESALQLLYLGLAGYGWWQWRRGAAGAPLPVKRAPRRVHRLLILGIAVLTVASGLLLTRYTAAALPFVDAGISWASVVATWLTARKWLENWFYWFVIDVASVGVYLDRGLYATAALFAVYLGLIVVGYRSWRATLH